MTTFADVVAATLADAGVDRIFGVPGSLSSVELIEASAKRGIRYVLCSNESSAVVMAATCGVLQNRPGVVSTGVGPGAAAAVHGVAHCFLEQAPVLVLTDRYASKEFHRLPRQRLQQDQLFRPITKASFELTTHSAAVTIRNAIDISMSARQGPVHIDMPYDVMLAEASDDDFPGLAKTEHFVSRSGVDNGGLNKIRAAIESSSRPALIVGAQVSRAGKLAEEAFLRFAERLRAPVFASLSAKGTIPEQNPLAMGIFRGAPFEREIIDQADLLVVIGLDPVEIFAPGGWPYPQPTVLLDEVTHLDGIISAQVAVVSNLTDSLDVLSDITPASGWNPESLDAYKQGRRSALETSGEGLATEAVIRLAREHLPEDGIMSVDAGQHKVLVSDTWETRRNRGFLSSSGLGTMAVSLPAALAAKMVEPQTPVLCLVGDGGFLMRIGDLETAIREQLPIVVVIFNDRALNLIRMQQDRRGHRRLGTEFADCDFAATARSFGFDAARVASEDALAGALSTAFASGRPWLIDAQISET